MKKTRTFTGILGALLGALIGTGIILLLDQSGYKHADIFATRISGLEAFFFHRYWLFALVSGICFALTTLLLSGKLAGGMNKTTWIVCILLLIVVPFFADWVAWGFTQKWDYSIDTHFSHYFLLVPKHIEAGAGYRQHMVIDAAFYVCNLVTLYSGVLAGALGTRRILRRTKTN